MAADFIHARALDLLDAASDGLGIARTGHAAPTRQYVSHGRPAVDICDDEIPGNGQLTVHVDATRGVFNRSAPSNPAVPKSLQIVPIVTYVIELWRCWPTMREDGAAPTASTIETAVANLNRDAWCMLTQIYSELAAGTLFSGVACNEVTIGDCQPTGDPSGGTAGWSLRIQVPLNDITAPAAG